jgi:hypothetical protein
LKSTVFFATLAFSSLLALDASARGRSCTPRSDVFGYHTCSPFGSGWTTEFAGPFVLELHFEDAFINADRHTIHNSYGLKPNVVDFSYPGKLIGHSLSDWTVGFGAAGYFVPWAYAGLSFAIGGGEDRLPVVVGSSPSTLSAASGFGVAVEATAFSGLRLPLGYLSLRTETLLGVHSHDFSQRVIDSTGRRQSVDDSFDAGLVEQRAYLDVWARPWMTVSIFTGLNFIDLKDRFVGLTTGFHLLNYEGAFLP